MQRFILCLLATLLFCSCDDDSESLCEDVPCEGDGLVCSEEDGECHCGGEDGPICGEEEVCDEVTGTCLPGRCADVTCELEGTVCAEDGECHCGDADGPVCGEYEVCDGETSTCSPALPDPVCNGGTRWTEGTRAFREATEDWGLEGVEGTRLNLVDFNGDGWVDVLVRRGATRADDFASGGTRSTWLLRNDEGAGFTDVTEDSGLLALRENDDADLGRPNTIAAFADVDNDGDMDAFTGTETTDTDVSMGERSELLFNDGDGVFTLRESEPPDGFAWLGAPSGASFIDANLDGFIDLWVTQSSGRTGPLQDRLMLGDGTGEFVDTTPDALLFTQGWESIDALNAGEAHTHGWGAAACDLNGDGVAELLSPSYGRSPNHLWQGSLSGSDDVVYENRSVASGYAFDDDQTWQDNQFAACYCRDNPTAEGCDEVDDPVVVCADNWNHATDREPFRLGGNSASTFCADIDNDGDIDLLTGEIRHWWAGAGSDGSEILVNTGESDVRFERPGDAATGLEADHLGRSSWDEGHMTNAVFDFDNDGWLDVYIGASDYPGNRGMLYHQESPLSFVELSVDDFFEHNRSHGVVTADVDRDGDLDVIVGHSRARCSATEPNNCYETMQVRLFENVMDEGNWLQIHLVGGEGSNRAAIGARVTVTAGDVTQTQEVDGGMGHYGSQRDAVLHFGLGEACEATVTVRWPNAELSEEEHTLPAGYRFTLIQGEAPRVAE